MEPGPLIIDEELYPRVEKFKYRLIQWAQEQGQVAATENSGLPIVSIEIPVFKGEWLMQCIESVLYQTVNRWVLYLVWDEGDALSNYILQMVHQLNHPKLNVFFRENQGIARSRHFLSGIADEDYIIPLDDDDMLDARIVEELTGEAVLKPWASIIRARRRYIDENGNLLNMPDWFPFEHRKYQYGMVTDIHNHCQPTLLSRKAYRETSGWEGFPDFYYAGEDCDMYLKLEEKGAIELYDKVLYYYRLNTKRTSHLLTTEGAYEMWRRLADKSIARIGLPLRRVNAHPPFVYERKPLPVYTKDMIDFVIPFAETDEKELLYSKCTHAAGLGLQYYELTTDRCFRQKLSDEFVPCSRIELSVSSEKYTEGVLYVQISEPSSGKIIAGGKALWQGETEVPQPVSILISQVAVSMAKEYILSLGFIPSMEDSRTVKVSFDDLDEPVLFCRFFRFEKGHCKKSLDRCLDSLKRAGIRDSAIYVINEKRSCSKNRNYGYHQTRQPLICFMDDNTELIHEESLDEMLSLMTTQNADLIGPRIVTGENTIFSADPYFNENQWPVPGGANENDDGRYQYIREAPWLTSAFLIVKREVIKAINGFDETYEDSRNEDADFCLKARSRNFRCIYAGKTSVQHRNSQRIDCFGRDFEQFILRWGKHKELFREIKPARL